MIESFSLFHLQTKHFVCTVFSPLYLHRRHVDIVFIYLIISKGFKKNSPRSSSIGPVSSTQMSEHKKKPLSTASNICTRTYLSWIQFDLTIPLTSNAIGTYHIPYDLKDGDDREKTSARRQGKARKSSLSIIILYIIQVDFLPVFSLCIMRCCSINLDPIHSHYCHSEFQ